MDVTFGSDIFTSNDELSGWPMVLAIPLRVASPLDWLVVVSLKLMESIMANYFDDDTSKFPWSKEMWSKWILLGDPHIRIMPVPLQNVAKRIETAIETIRKEKEK